jgi:hypothetical protein
LRSFWKVWALKATARLRRSPKARHLSRGLIFKHKFLIDSKTIIKGYPMAKKYKNGELKDVRFELVCLVIYNENNIVKGDSEITIKESVKEIIKNRCVSFKKTKFDIIDPKVLKRINYIVFPIWKLDELLDIFQTKVGS